MADIFISYSRANQQKVAQLADAITQAGYSVWWDAELPPHRSYGDVITEEIATAKATIVVWSETAAASEWVRAEADLARNQKKLIQASLDDILPPMPFNQIQFAFIGDWNGEPDHMGWRKIRTSLAALCGDREGDVSPVAAPAPRAAPVAETVPVQAPARTRDGLMPALVGGGLVAAGAIGFFIWNGQENGATVAQEGDVVAVTAPAQNMASPAAADSGPTARYDLAAMTEDPDGFTNIRSGPSATAAVIGRVTKGEAFTTFKQDGGWWRVRTADGKTGWISRKMIRLLGTDAPAPAAVATAALSGPFDLVAEISDPRPGPTNVRAGPSVNDPIVAEVNNDESFTTFRQEGGWWQVRTTDGITGWMSRKMIRVRGGNAAGGTGKE